MPSASRDPRDAMRTRTGPAGFPAQSWPAGMRPRTTEPAPTTAASPITTPLSRIEWPPTNAREPIATGAVRAPRLPPRARSSASSEWKSVS
jgi:hypothetical protein